MNWRIPYARDYKIESIENAPGNRGVFLYPRRAHLLTTCYTSGGILPKGQARALSEGDAASADAYGGYRKPLSSTQLECGDCIT